MHACCDLSCVNTYLQASRPMKTRLAKLVVELAKREFPQAWPSLLTELRHHWL